MDGAGHHTAQGAGTDSYEKFISYGATKGSMGTAITGLDADLLKLPQSLRQQAAEVLVSVFPDEVGDTGAEHLSAVNALRRILDDFTRQRLDPEPLLAYLESQVMHPADVGLYIGVYEAGSMAPSLPVQYKYGGRGPINGSVWNPLLANAGDAGALRERLEYIAAHDGGVMAALAGRAKKYAADPKLFVHDTIRLAHFIARMEHKNGEISKEERRGLSALAKLAGPRDYMAAFLHATTESYMLMDESTRCLRELGRAGNAQDAENVLRKYNI